MTTHSGTLGGMAKRRRVPQPDPPPRPTVADADAWLADIDRVLDTCDCGQALPTGPPYHFVVCSCGRTYRWKGES